MSDISGSRKVGFGVLSSLLGVVIALVIVEFAVGVLKPQIDPAGRMDEGFILYDERLGWKLAPGWRGRHDHHDFEVRYGVNSLGFRGDALGFSRPGSVMFLGDSFTFGLGVNDDEVFTGLLDQSNGQNFTNAGMPGYSTDQQLLLLEDLLAYKPEVLVWVVYLGNDLLDNGEPFPLQAAHGKPYFELVPGEGLVLENVPVPREPKPAEFRSRSVKTEILGDYQPYMFWQSWIEGFELGQVVNQWVGFDSRGLRQHLQDHTREQVELFMAMIERGQTMLRDSGARLQVVLLPGQGYTRENSIPQVYQKTLSSILESHLGEADIPVVSVGDKLEAVDNPGDLFHPNEGHFNAEGHRWLAKVLNDSSDW